MAALLRYDGKRVIITGAHSGMGWETANLLPDAGAEIYALDTKPVGGAIVRFIPTDIGNPKAIDAAVEQIGGPIDCLFHCAGIPQTFAPVEVMSVNLLGLRHLTERVLPLMPAGGAIAHIASIRGIGWQDKLTVIKELLATPDFESGREWCGRHPEEIAPAMLFLNSAEASYVNGHNLVGDDGFSAALATGIVDYSGIAA